MKIKINVTNKFKEDAQKVMLLFLIVSICVVFIVISFIIGYTSVYFDFLSFTPLYAIPDNITFIEFLFSDKEYLFHDSHLKDMFLVESILKTVVLVLLSLLFFFTLKYFKKTYR